jgi:hypothetical protein
MHSDCGDDMRMLFSALFLAICASASGLVFAGSCPAGAKDCFLCGGVDGMACTTNCTGAYVEGVGNVSCECPQDEPCVCYCPYGGGSAVVLDDETLISRAPDCGPGGCGGNDCGIVENLTGTVAVKRGGGWCIAKGGTGIAAGARVWVLDGARVRIRLFDGGVMDVRENSVFNIDRIETTKPGAVKRMVLSLAEGAYHHMVDSDRIEQFEVRMDSAVIGINGTEFIVEADGSEITVKVLEGSVSLSNDGSGIPVLLRPGEYSIASKSGGPPTKPAAFNAAMEGKWWVEPSAPSCGSAFALAAALMAALFLGGRA